ncbi:MAG TPA: DMT family transporter [Candidatus Cybelea sp.]|nr:DMT family transporter [Candidatus Cybelea sp.]
MGESLGVLAAMLSSGLGGIAAGTTRFIIGAVDPVTLGAFRYGGGFLILLPIALAKSRRWPEARDLPAVAGLGLLFFGIFPVFYNAALYYTTAARGALALSTLPLLTMLIAALLGIEPLTWRKTCGVLVAVGGVTISLGLGLSQAPAGAWRGDGLMMTGAVLMALYTIWSKAYIARSSALTFATASIAAGAGCLVLFALTRNGFAASAQFGPAQWAGVAYLAVGGGAVNFLLWVWALGRATPTRVANTITVNPVTASITAALLIGEPIRFDTLFGIAAVFAGIWIASTMRRSPAAAA